MNDAYILKHNPDLIDRKVIEDIRSEISKPLDGFVPKSTAERMQAIALTWCLQTIDKHLEKWEADHA